MPGSRAAVPYWATYDPDAAHGRRNCGNSKGKDNLYVARFSVQAETGEPRWHYQTVPGDSWDFHTVQQFLVPSGMARVTILAAVAMGLIEAFGVGRGNNIGRGIFLILTYTAGVFDKTIIPGAAAITGRGIIENFGHVPVLWSCSLLVVSSFGHRDDSGSVAAALWLDLPEAASLPGGRHYPAEELRKAVPWSAMKKKCLALMLGSIVLWASDFIHHISPAMIGLGIGLVAGAVVLEYS
jgi:hypothetical protein